MKNIETIVNFIKESFLFNNGFKFNGDTNLFEKGILDSTGIIELISFIERNYDIVVEDDELLLDNFSTINSIESFLAQKNAIVLK
jgi:acyl carrier protein